jgi:hypothetical protein
MEFEEMQQKGWGEIQRLAHRRRESRVTALETSAADACKGASTVVGTDLGISPSWLLGIAIEPAA